MNTIHHGNITSLTGANAINPHLPASVYDVQFNPQRGEFELHHRPSFAMPEKIYGDHDVFVDRCIKTFSSMSKGMAVLLSGPKGCGKTLTAKKLAIQCKMPVLCINTSFAGTGFISFLTDLPTKSLIFIDEFEKTYSDVDDRKAFLSLLDGASDNKHLFVLTSNEPEIGEFFTNRPGRIRYHRKYEELPISILKEIIDDKMSKGKLRDAMHATVDELGVISPDALISMIQECLIHNETPDKFMDFFNVKTELSGSFDVSVKTSGFKPKQGLGPKQQESAIQFIRALVEDGEDYATSVYSRGMGHCERIDEMWQAKHIKPFDSRDQKNGLSADVYWTEMTGTKRNRSFEIRPNTIKSMSRKGGGITIEDKKGQVFTFTKSKGPAYHRAE